MSKRNFPFLLFLFLMSCVTIQAQSPKIEYIAHAAFVIESSQGTRVVLDPYHSYRQMGFTFPEDISADFVLITHPHYDHDGSQYFSKNTPVYRDAGAYQFKDIVFKGIASKHSFAEQIGKSGNQNYNTIWVVEVDGIKIAHLGDNEVPTTEEVKQLADVDYIIGHPRDAYFTLFPNAVYIPNHYLLPEITKHKNWMQPVDGWLTDKKGVVQLATNTYKLIQDEASTKILVFTPSSFVQEWSQEYYAALAAMKEGSELQKASGDFEMILTAYDKAIMLAPYVMDGYYAKAVTLSRKQNYQETIAVLQKAFVAVPDMDWGVEAKARALLAEAYIATNQSTLAYSQYVWLSRHDRIVNRMTIEKAEAFIKNYLANK
ncbi:MBL fold metallo-hydrolase [uncultured Dokdonia sp.]|uniref:MBL fold metallo-hydrolase n=1 Tax=uncultured Dokdonia sp. TaxID=575653 RepID=UPI0026244C2A|nr:MBL fold metallo-hydrolase [uncultured Dokdonia sp.]